MFMFIGCAFVVLYFRESSKMEAAYGLAIIVTMIMTTLLFANYLVLHRVKPIYIYIFLAGYLCIEFAYLVALMDKFLHGGYITLIFGSVHAESKTDMWSLCDWIITCRCCRS
jgi:KUP system potassium uptake protein